MWLRHKDTCSEVEEREREGGGGGAGRPPSVLMFGGPYLSIIVLTTSLKGMAFIHLKLGSAIIIILK